MHRAWLPGLHLPARAPTVTAAVKRPGRPAVTDEEHCQRDEPRSPLIFENIGALGLRTSVRVVLGDELTGPPPPASLRPGVGWRDRPITVQSGDRCPRT